MAKKFPKQIFVRIENEGTQDELLIATERESSHAVIDESCRVGRYVLAETMSVDGVTSVKNRKPAQR